MIKKEVKKIDKKTDKSLSGWGVAITDAKIKIEEAKERILCMKQAIRAFEDLRDSGHPFPGENRGEMEVDGPGVLGQPGDI